MKEVYMRLPVLLALVSTCLFPAVASAQCRVARVAQMPMTVEHNRLFVPVTVNETAGKFMVDTGAFHSLIDAGFASRAGVRMDTHQPRYTLGGFGGNSLPVQAGRLRMFEFAGAKIPDREMPIYDFSQDFARVGIPVDGLLGADMLNLLDVELDFPGNTLSLWRLFDCHDIEPLHWSGDYASIPMARQSDKHVKIPIWVDGADMDAMLDTGAGGLLLSREAALHAGATEDQLGHDPVMEGAGIGGKGTSRRHRFHVILIGKDVYHDMDAAVSDRPADKRGMFENFDAIVGMRYLFHHRVWISYGTETLFLQDLPKP
jgi:predicted aspartyl protease